VAVLGDNTQGVDSFPCSGDRALVTALTAVDSGSINSAYAYFDPGSSAGMNAKVILHQHDGTDPTALVAVSSSLAVPSGGGLVGPFTMSGSFSAGLLAVGIVADNYEAQLQEDLYVTGFTTQMANGTYSFASPPASWPGTDGTYASVQLNVWIDYTPSGGGGSILIPKQSSRIARLLSF